MPSKFRLVFLWLTALLLFPVWGDSTAFEHIWHTPSDDSEVPENITMRDPLFPGVSTTVTFYQGVWKGDGYPGDPADQTGGTLYYRVDGGSWQTEDLGFHANIAENSVDHVQFWKAELTMPANVGAQIEYYFFVTFNNRDDTYLFEGDGENNLKSLVEADARAEPYSFTVSPVNLSGNAEFEVDGLNADYRVLNFYIDEIQDGMFPTIDLLVRPGVTVTDVEIFTNLNNRDRAHLDYNNDGYEDGIIPVDGNTITVSDTGAYFQAYTMEPDGPGTFRLTLPVNKTGAYRLTARFRENETDALTWLGDPYDPGSPYSIRNFWEINPYYTHDFNGSLTNAYEHPDNYTAEMTAFQNFAAAADDQGVYLMLDFPFNHTSPDVVLGQMGVELFAPEGNPDNWQPTDQIVSYVPQLFYTNGGEGVPAYSAPAQSTFGRAVAPDRNDFGKWVDVVDVFFGNYSTLVTGYRDAETSRQIVRNEDDLMYYDSMGDVTINVWRYFGEVLPYWIAQSGHRGHNEADPNWDLETLLAEDVKGIDGLRKDFGQGLPPQAMEYIIGSTPGVSLQGVAGAATAWCTARILSRGPPFRNGSRPGTGWWCLRTDRFSLKTARRIPPAACTRFSLNGCKFKLKA